ncbi:MAG TPA: hypothetical protein VNQ76_12365 [Planctomicrobium sp.]|nr:hypothetical protein [Planctomicrobium sp.]
MGYRRPLLSDLTDVNPTGLADTRILRWDAESGKHVYSDLNLAAVTGLKDAMEALASVIDGKISANDPITGGTKTKVTYDSKGLVTGGADATTADIADSSNRRYVTDAFLSVLGLTSGVNTGDQDLSGYSVVGHRHTIEGVDDLTSTLASKADLVGGKLATSQLPALAIVEFLGSVTSEEEMLELDGQRGDWCIRSDEQLAFFLVDDDPTQVESWQQITTPASPVLSVNNQTGAIVLSYSDVGAAAASHNHTIGDVTDLASALSALETLIDELDVSDISGLTDALEGKASSVHSHAISDTTGLQSALDGKPGLSAANVFTANQTFQTNLVSVTGSSDPELRVAEGGSTTNYLSLKDVTAAYAIISKATQTGTATLDISSTPLDGTSSSDVRLFRQTNTTGARQLQLYRGNGTSDLEHILNCNGNSYLNMTTGNVAIGSNTVPTEKLTVNGNITATRALLGAGSAAAPPVKVGSSEMGLFEDSTNTLGFTVAGSRKAALSSSGLLLQHSVSNNSQKLGRLSCAHYNNAEEPVAGIFIDSSASSSFVNIGGSSGVANAATHVRIWAAGNGTTTTGTQVAEFTINSCTLGRSLVLALLADSDAENNSLFRGSEHSGKLCWKDVSGVVKVVAFE